MARVSDIIAIIAIILAVIAIGLSAATFMRPPTSTTTTIITTVYKTAAPVTVTKTMTATAATKPLKKVTLTIEFCEPHKALFMPAIEKFKEEMRKKGYDVDVKIIMIPYGVDCATKVTQDLAAGTAGDVIDEDSFLLSSVAAAGYIYPLDQFIKNWPDWNEFAPAMRKMVTFNGHVYGIMIDTDVRMLYYRKDIFKLCGIPVPWQPKTWDDILKTAIKLKECAPKIEKALGVSEFYPIILPAGLKWGEATPCQGFWMLLVGADKPPLNRLYDYKHHKWICKSTALYRAFKFYIDVYVKYKVGNNEVNLASDPWAAHRKSFSEGTSAIDFGGSWEFFEGWGPTGIAPLPVCTKKCGCKGGKCTTPSQKSCYLSCEWDVIGIAKMPGYKGGAEGEPKYVSISGGWFVGINAKLAKNPEKLKLAWEFIKILTSRENEALYAAKYGKPAPRLDAIEVPEYASNKYIRLISEFIKFTDYRDALPQYPKVSKIIQWVTQLIIEGKVTSPDQALDLYCKKLKQTVGADNVIEYPVRKS